MKRALILLILIGAMAGSSFAQTTSVTLQTTDAGSQSWNKGTYTATLAAPAGVVNPTFYLGGVLMTPSQLQLTGALNSSGGASFSLGQNGSITPVGSSWTFTVCPQATASCYTQSLTVSGASQTVTLTPPAILINLSNSPANTSAYADSEITGVVLGATYFNLTTSLQRICTVVSGNSCTTWVNNGTGTGGFTPSINGTPLSTAGLNLQTSTTNATGLACTPTLVSTINVIPCEISGTVNAANVGTVMTTLGDITYENATPTPARLAGCTLAVGVACTLTSTATSGPTAAAPVWGLPGVAVNNNSETTCIGATLNIIDRATSIFCSGGTTGAFTLPVHTTPGFGSNYAFDIFNGNSGNLNLSPTTDTIDRGTLLPGWTAYLRNNLSGNWQSNQFPTYSAFGATCANPLSWSTTAGFACLPGTSGGIPYFSAANTWASSGVLTANLPVIGGGAGVAPSVGTVTGNTTQFATWSGATTASRCAHTDANGNLTAAAADCSTGSSALSSLTAATGANSINNGDNDQVWNWSLTTASTFGFTIGENVASTATGTPFLLKVANLSGSTAGLAKFVGTGGHGVTVLSNGNLDCDITAICSVGGVNGYTLMNSQIFGYAGGGSTSAVIYRAGNDSAQNGVGAGATFRGSDNNNASNTSVGGAATLRGGDEAAATTNTTGGAVTIRGGNVSSTSTSTVGGAVSITGGSCTAVTSASTCPGIVKIAQPSFTTGTVANNDLACVTAADTVASCSGTGNGSFIGVIDSTSTNNTFVVPLGSGGTHTFNAASATFTNGHFVCQSTAATSANLVVDSSTICGTGLGVGIYYGATGTTTTPLVWMRSY